MVKPSQRTTTALLVILAVAVGCESAEEITMSCVVEGDPIRIGDPTAQGGHQIATMGGALLFTQLESASDVWTGQWVDKATGTPLGAPIDMGRGAGMRPSWVPSGDSLRGLLATDLLHRDPEEIPANEFLGQWRVTPPPSEMAGRTPVMLDIPADCLGCLSQGAMPDIPGEHGAFPIVVVDDAPIAVLTTIPNECIVSERYGNLARLRFVDLETGIERGVWWGEQPCAPLPSENLIVRAPWPVALSDGNIGVLFTSPDWAYPGHRQYLVPNQAPKKADGLEFT